MQNNNLDELSTWYKIIKWKIIGLCFTDAKISEWLKNSQLYFGTTDPYGAVTFISQLCLATMYINYFRYVSQTPKPAFIFVTERKLLSNLCNKCLQEIGNSISKARSIFEQTHRIEYYKVMQQLRNTKFMLVLAQYIILKKYLIS